MTNRALVLTTIVILLSPSTPQAAQQAAPQPAQAPPARPTVTAVRLGDGESILIDGRLDEPVWSRAVPAASFIQVDPDNGQAATERTEVRIAYNQKMLYMGVICYDSEPDRLLRFQRRRDEFLSSDDRFQWVFDPFLTGQNGYFFETNPSGLMGDSLLSPTGNNRQWDGIWTLRVERTDVGWTVEVEIPFSTLSFDPKGTAWGINFQRTVRRKNEDSLWTGWARNQGLQRLSNTGRLQGLSGPSQGLGIDVRPYGLATAEAAPGSGQPDARTEGKVGLDMIYSPTPGLRANLTLNTDFAQTDVDKRLVNLTQFALFFPEKRSFFLEGANLFDFGSVQPVGGGGGGGGFNKPSDNSLIPFFSRRIGLDTAGNPQAVDYGVKLFGQLGRQDVGVLHLRTATDGGVLGEDFSVIRVKRRLMRQSYAGVLYTRRDSTTSGATTLDTTGADFRLATSGFRGSQNLSLGGFWLQSTNPLGTGRSAAYGLRMDYPNDRWNGGMIYRAVQEHFSPAVGFLQRNNYEEYNPYFNFSPRPRNNKYIRRMGFTADVDLKSGLTNSYVSRLWNLTVLNIDFHTQDSISVLVIADQERLDRPFRPSAGVTLPVGSDYSFLRYRVTGGTANRRTVAVSPTIEWGSFYSGTRTQMGADVTLRARPGVIVYLSSEWNRVNLPEGYFETRLYRATPELQFSQWISVVNTIQYDSVSRVLGWQGRFRWILKPGNDIYFVYTHNWQEDTNLDRFSTVNRRAASKIIYTQRF
ncbi:MAG: hypothetical protein A3G76_00610 [Acidobacteria bacterium RIFCSPLOWO2_12_FULL_65_11]|nr:MAG: hypothetical protein A3G76_00610 [Acidobacteria bacterium RIFCSPLOWO2_12_FULL_65_11]